MKKIGMDALDEVCVAARTALVYVEIDKIPDPTYNVSADACQIKKCVPVLRKLANRGAKVVVLVHQCGDRKRDSDESLRPYTQVLEQTLGIKVKLVPDVYGPVAQYAIRELWPGDVLVLDNMRIMAEDQAELRAVDILAPQP